MRQGDVESRRAQGPGMGERPAMKMKLGLP